MMTLSGVYIPESAVDPGGNLGCLAWYSVRNAEPTRDEIAASLRKAGFDEQIYTPKAIFASDAFRRATSSVEISRVPLNEYPDDDRKANILVREVLKDREKIVRHLVREVVDADNQRLDYRETASLTLDRKSETLKVTPFTFLLEPETQALMQARQRYEHQREHYDSNAVRQIVLRILRDCDPIAVRPAGGVYFVHQKHLDTVERLGTFLRNISDESRMWVVPVANDQSQREMVSASVTEQVEAEGERIILSLDKYFAGGEEITEEALQAALEEARHLERLTADYEELLAERLDRARAALTVTRERIAALWAKV